MHRRLAGRLAGMILALLAVSLIAFLALATIPGDAASALIGETASSEQLASLRAEMGLDRPLAARYLTFMGNLLRGDLGRSLVSDRPVGRLAEVRLPALS